MELVSHLFPAAGRDTGNDPVLIMPIGDIQWAGDESEVALKMLRKHIQWGVDQGAWFIGMGDYIDTLSPSNRAKLRAASLYDTAIKSIDAMAQKLTDELYEEALEPSRGRWLGLLEGHHFHEMSDGTTSDQRLTSLLHAPFLGSSAYVRLRFAMKKMRGDVLIWAHHGTGAGSTPAAVLNKLRAVSAAFEADIYLMGHLHRKVAEPIDYCMPIYPSKGGLPVLTHRTRILAGTGSFLKGYREHARIGQVPRGGYAEQKMMNPLSLGGVLLKVRPRWKDTPAGALFLPDLNVEL